MTRSSLRSPRQFMALTMLPLLATLLACDGEKTAVPVETSAQTEGYEARIVRTDYGIPHITANTWGSLGFGEAYAAAEDHVCNMAVALLQAQGESARVFGPGHDNSNLARDIVVKALGIPQQARMAFEEQPADIRDWITGYSAGYNHFLAQHADGVGSWCDRAEWVQPAEPERFMAQYLTLVQTLPRIGNAIVAATLPSVAEDSLTEDAAALQLVNEQLASTASPYFEAPQLDDTLNALKLQDMGSNAWALAKSRTEGANSLLLANPHYPWFGIARFWEKHLTLPGQYDAYGAGLIGIPGVALGFNQHVGWSHTVSDSKRTVIYQLTLNPDNPQEYRWEDGWRELQSVVVDVATKDSSEATKHTVWFSHHGPLLAMPGLTEDPYTVFAVRDANADNTLVLSQWRAMGQSHGMDEFIDAHRRFNAMPWVNTIAVSADGRGVYLDNSTVGALSDETIANWREQVAATPMLEQLYLTKGLVILDGSKASNDWLETDAPIANTVPFEQRPLIESEAYVFNANDSYWLSDPSSPATALSPLYGATESPRSLRTRMNVSLLEPDSPWGYAGDDGRFSMAEVQSALFGNDSLTAHLVLPELLAACAIAPEHTVRDRTVNLTEACNLLMQWDRKMDLNSRGAVLFREWLTRYPYTSTLFGTSLFAQAFDAKQPLSTPSRLNNADTALATLAEAVLLLHDADIALDVALGDLQRGHRMDQQIALHGGNRWEGIANLQIPAKRSERVVGTDGQYMTAISTGREDYRGDSVSLAEDGYKIIHGSSFIMTLAFTDEGPKAQAILSYSQSGDPSSAHFADQTLLYRDKQWRDILFSPEAIAQNAHSEIVVRSSAQ